MLARPVSTTATVLPASARSLTTSKLHAASLCSTAAKLGQNSQQKTAPSFSEETVATLTEIDQQEPGGGEEGATQKAQSEEQLPQSTVSKKNTVAEQDAELRRRLEGISGDGGESGIEYEDGAPVAMKRNVKNNMFRLI